MDTLGSSVRRDVHSSFMSECSYKIYHQQSRAANGPLFMASTTKGHRPKSADSSTKPLRSSPLAGPALNRSLTAFSTPALAVNDQLLIPPPCHVHPKSCQTFDASYTQPFCDACSSTFRRRSFSPTAGGMRGSGRSQSMYGPSTSDSGRASTSKLRTATAAILEWEIDPLQGPIPSRSSASRTRPRSSAGISSFPRPIPIVEEETDQEEVEPSTPASKDNSNTSSTSEFTHSRSKSLTPDNSWYTVNTYDVTPRFSRLGLSASNVVMPLSVKEHRRLSRNTSHAKTNSSKGSNSTSPTKGFSIISALSPKSSTAPTRVRLQPHSPPKSPQPSPSPELQSQPLSRTVSTTSSSETSSLTSNPQRETHTPVSTSTSAPSLTRSRNSEDSISTWYESLPPSTPSLERDTVLPTEEDGKGCEKGDKGDKVDDGRDGEIDQLRGVDDHDHDRIHYSDITVRKGSDDDDTKPEQELASNSVTTEQPKTLIYQPQPRPQPRPTATPPNFQIHASPQNDIKNVRDSLRKKLVRIKLQPHDFDDLEGVQSSFSAMGTMETTKPPPITMAEVEVGLTVGIGATLPVPPLAVDSKDTLASVPTPSLKKKRSTFKGVLKSFIGK